MSLDGPRIPNVPPEKWTPEVEAVFPISVPPGAPVKGSDFDSILMLATHPPLATAWLNWSVAIGKGWTLPARFKEIAILRVAWHYKADYEWTHHVVFALQQGMTAEHILALQGDVSNPIWTDMEGWVIQAADDSVEKRGLSQEVWEGLSMEFNHEQILELLFVIGSYMALSIVLNTAGVQPEPMFVDLLHTQNLPSVDG